MRRLRSALRIFGDVIGAERAEAWRAALGDTGRALGGARDWDVFATEALPPVLATYGDAALARQLPARASRERRKEREAARAALRARPHAVGCAMPVVRVTRPPA